MCGRFALLAHQELLRDRFGIDKFEATIEERYNIAPDQHVPVIIKEDSQIKLVEMKWGFLPFWSKEPTTEYSTINARSESAHVRPAFRFSFAKRRCLIPVSGFYEWKGPSGNRTPHFIRLKNQEPFAFAGLYDIWKSEDGKTEIRSFTILTTEPNADMESIHNRMPVILEGPNEKVWLNADETVEELRKLMFPYPGGLLESYEVSRYVNKPENLGPKCIEPVRVDQLTLELD